MKTYQVIIEPEAKRQIRRHLFYIKTRLKNPQAAESVYTDFLTSAGKLSTAAGSIKEAEDEELIRRNLKRKNFDRHEYFMLFKVDDGEARVTNVFHFRENYIAKLR